MSHTRKVRQQLRPAVFFASLILPTLLVSTPAFAKPDLRQTARILAGLDTSALDGKHKAHADRYAKVAEARWKQYEDKFGDPLADWSKKNLDQTRSDTIFYPFGGPDFVTAHRLYPGASRYVLIGLETGGSVPKIDGDDRRFNAMLGLFRTGLVKFAQRGFFITKQMKKVFGKVKIVDGITGVLMLFAEREGLAVRSVEPITVTGDGKVTVIKGGRDEVETWNSVRLTVERSGKTVLIDYLQLNLADQNLRKNAGDRKFVESMSSNRVVLKAASHLLQQQYGFHTIRDALLTRARSIWQDETGLDYDLLNEKFQVKLYGKFRRANRLFPEKSQRALAKAYRTRDDIEPLPFVLGYFKAAGSCVQYAHRRR